MEANQSEKRLSDLPESSHEYWSDSERNLHKVVQPEEHKHYFEKVEGAREAKCKCGFGLFLSAEDNVHDGHLYQNGQLVY